MFLTTMGIFPIVMFVIGLIGSLMSLITLGVVVRSYNKDVQTPRRVQSRPYPLGRHRGNPGEAPRAGGRA